MLQSIVGHEYLYDENICTTKIIFNNSALCAFPDTIYSVGKLKIGHGFRRRLTELPISNV